MPLAGYRDDDEACGACTEPGGCATQRRGRADCSLRQIPGQRPGPGDGDRGRRPGHDSACEEEPGGTRARASDGGTG